MVNSTTLARMGWRWLYVTAIKLRNHSVNRHNRQSPHIHVVAAVVQNVSSKTCFGLLNSL